MCATPRRTGGDGPCAAGRRRRRGRLRQRALLAPTRVVRTSARYIPLAVSTTPSRCRQPPRGTDNPLAVSTTPRDADNARRRTAAPSHPSPSGGAPETASQTTAGYRVERPAFSNPKSMLTSFLHNMLFSNGKFHFERDNITLQRYNACKVWYRLASDDFPCESPTCPGRRCVPCVCATRTAPCESPTSPGRRCVSCPIHRLPRPRRTAPAPGRQGAPRGRSKEEKEQRKGENSTERTQAPGTGACPRAPATEPPSSPAPSPTCPTPARA